MSTTAPRGDDNFLNVKEGDDYTVLRLVGAGENAVVLSTADAHKVAKDVADGVLLAREEDGSFVMEGVKEDLDRYAARSIGTLLSL